MGAVAARALAGFIGPEPVTCKREGEDVYHRILATCFVRGEDIQRWMVAQGHALAFTRYTRPTPPTARTRSRLPTSGRTRPAGRARDRASRERSPIP